MEAQVHEVGVAGPREDVLGAVAVVDVEVEDGHAGETIEAEQASATIGFSNVIS